MTLLDRRELLILGGGLALSLRTLGVRALEASATPAYAVQMQTLKYAAPDGVDLLLDLYLPQGAPGPLPLIVFLHGGGFQVHLRLVSHPAVMVDRCACMRGARVA